jgi:hypothetical protein
MRWRIPLVVVLALFVAVSCDQQPAEPPADQVAEAPAFNWMNNPDNGNFKVYRDVFDLRVCWSDSNNGLRVCQSTVLLSQAGWPGTPEGGPEPDCGLQEAEGSVDYQDVGTYVGDIPESWLHAHQQGDAWITIRDENTAGDCFGDALVAEGWGRVSGNDNDVFGTGDGANANTFRFRGHGKLEASDGSDVMYNGHWQWVCWPDHPNRACNVTSVVNLH